MNDVFSELIFFITIHIELPELKKTGKQFLLNFKMDFNRAVERPQREVLLCFIRNFFPSFFYNLVHTTADF